MSEQRHIIKRQIIELTVEDSAVALALQDEISRVYHQRIIPLIEQCCSELSQPDRLYRIDSLELDLGDLDALDIEEQFVAKVEVALREALSAQIDSQEDKALQTAQHSPKAQSALELFAFFVDTGSLPWWADDSQPQLLAENLQQLLRETPQELRHLLQTLAREAHTRERIISQYSDQQLAQLAGLLVPAYQSSFTQERQALKSLLQKTKTGAAWQPTRLGRRIWSNILQTASLGGQQYPSLEAFYQAVLKRLAAELGTTGNGLIDELQQLLQDGKTSHSMATRRLKELLEQLTRANTSAANLVLTRRLEQLQAASAGPLAEVWAGMRALAPRLSDSLRAQWSAALDALGNAPSTPQTAGRIRQLLQPELVVQQILSQAELSRLNQLLQSALDAEDGISLKAKDAKNKSWVAPVKIGKELTARLKSYQSGGGPLAEIWTTLQALSLRLPPETQTAWLEALSALGSEVSAEEMIQFLNANPIQRSLRPEERTKLFNMLRAAPAPLIPPIFGVQNGGTQGGPDQPDLRFSDADELSVANAGLVILWPFLTSFFTRLGLMEDKQFKDLAARQRAVGLLQVIATKDVAPPEYLLPLNKLLCGLELKQVFDFGPPLLKSEARECANLLKAVIAQATILNKMSADGFRGTFLLRPGLLSVRDGLWLLRVERKTYDIVLERFPWSWEWVRLPWMEAPLRVEW